MKTTSIGGKSDTREVEVSVGVALPWLRVLVFAALLGAAHAQTLATQPTTATLSAATRSPATTRQIKDNQGAINAPGVVFTSTLPSNFVLINVSSTQGRPAPKETRSPAI